MTDEPRFVTEPLGKGHNRAAFSCGKESLDSYIERQAGQDRRRNLARVFVKTGDDEPRTIAGYYTLGALSITFEDLPEEQSRKLPNYRHIPAVLIGRLAIDRKYQGRGLGKLLLVDALKRIVTQGGQLGIYAVVVEPIDDEAARFYKRYGFIEFPSRSDRLFLPMHTVQQLFP